MSRDLNDDETEETDEDTSETGSETGDTPTISERIITRYPAHNWNVIDDDTLRLEAGDAYIEVGAYLVDDEDAASEIRADLEISYPRGGDLTMGDVSLDDLPEAIGQALVALHAQDVVHTGESANVGTEEIPEWAVAAFAEQAALVADSLAETAYFKTLDPDAYALRYVRAERAFQRTAWGVDANNGESDHARAEAAAWLVQSTEPGATLPPGTPGWAAKVKAQITEKWPDPEAAHEMSCIKAASLLLAEIARCRRARMKKEADDRAANAAAQTEEKTQP